MSSTGRDFALVSACVFVLALLLPIALASTGPRATPESAAALFVDRNLASLGVRPGNAELRLVDVAASRAGYHVMYQQVVGGVPVFGAMVNVFVDWGLVPRIAISGASEVRQTTRGAGAGSEGPHGGSAGQRVQRSGAAYPAQRGPPVSGGVRKLRVRQRGND